MPAESTRFADERADGSGSESVVSMCGICPAACGAEVFLRQGRIERLGPLVGHPRGFVCPRGARAPDIIYSPDRLRHPQIRVGPRGSNRFERATWPDAMERIDRAWWLAVFPGIGLFVAVLACNLVGEGIRDLLDPRTHGR